MRRSAAQLHALAKVEREIRATDPHPRRKYLRDFTEAYTHYSKVLEPGQLADELAAADILLVGDYHALPNCQQFTAELVENLRAAGYTVILGLEMIFARDQRIVAEWQHGHLSDDELRQRTRYDQEWGYDWEPTRELLLRARGAGALVRGLDCLPRGDLRRIARRDRHAALEIADIRFDHPTAKIVVLFGESHLAPKHLPKLVRAALPEARILAVLQNVDALYWQASGEPGDAVRAVRVDEDTVCVFNATPLEKYERYRLCIERWRQERPGAPDVAPTFYNLVNALLRFLRLDEEDRFGRARFEAELLPSVISVEEGDDLSSVLERPQRAVLTAGPATRQPMTELEMATIRDRLRRAGICYLPALNTVVVQRFEIGWAAEEAARFICCAGWGEVGLAEAGTSGEKAFYRTCLQHALLEYGARVLCPGRESVRDDELYALYGENREQVGSRWGMSYREFVRLIDFVALHRDFEKNARQYRAVPDLIREGRGYSAEKFVFVTQWLGRLLGVELYEAYLRGLVTKRSISRLLRRRAEKPKTAYFRLARLCGKIRRLT
jgi:hypothetical protein